MDSRQVAGALQGLSNGLGAFAGYEAQKEQMQAQEAVAARRDAANKAFQVMLYNAKAAQDQQQFDAQRAEHAADRKDMMDYRNRSLDAQTQYHQDSLAQQEALKRATLGIQSRQLQIDQQNADTQRMRATADKTAHGTDRTASVLSSRLTATGRLIQSYQKQRDAEMAKLSADVNLMADPAGLAAARRRVEAKYQPLIDKRQAEYDRLNQKFSELTGVDMGDPEVADEMGLMQDESRGVVNHDAPSSNGTETEANPAGLPTAADAGVPGENPGTRSGPGPGNIIRSLADIPPRAIDYLRAHPETLQLFNAKYGAGMGEQVLGKGNGGE